MNCEASEVLRSPLPAPACPAQPVRLNGFQNASQCVQYSYVDSPDDSSGTVAPRLRVIVSPLHHRTPHAEGVGESGEEACKAPWRQVTHIREASFTGSMPRKKQGPHCGFLHAFRSPSHAQFPLGIPSKGYGQQLEQT